jgi:hypothetical protein
VISELLGRQQGAGGLRTRDSLLRNPDGLILSRDRRRDYIRT